MLLFWDESLRETGEMGFGCCWGCWDWEVRKSSRSKTGWMESWSDVTEDVEVCLKSKEP